jgi:hypothetical protein
VYVLYTLIPRLRKLLAVEIFHRVPLPSDVKKAYKVRTRIVSLLITALQAPNPITAVNWQELDTFLTGRITVNHPTHPRTPDPYYRTFLLNAIRWVLQDVKNNILGNRVLFKDEKDSRTGQRHISFRNAKANFSAWLPVQYAILLRYESYSHQVTPPAYPRHKARLAPFTLLPKYHFTPKHIIINTDAALYDLWALAGWPGVAADHPTSIHAFQQHSEHWWNRTFRTEKVETRRTGQRRFRGAVYTDGISVRISVCKRVLYPARNAPVSDEGDLSDIEEVVEAEGEDDSEEEEGITRPVVDPNFRPVPLDVGVPVWGLDPGRHFIFYGVSNHGQTAKVSIDQYYNLCGFSETRKRREKWVKKDPAMKHTLANLSLETFKTSSLASFDRYLTALLPNLTRMLDFYFRRRHRRSKFHSYIRSQQAWDKMLAPFNGSVVALGAAVFQHNSRGRKTGPLQQLRKQLRSRVRELRLIGEYNTSRVCHGCEGFFGRQKHWGLRVCQSICGGRVMNRDYNAAHNILAIFLFMNARGGQRPSPFFHGWDRMAPQPGVH